MPMKQTGRKVYRSMQGKTVDMDLLRQRNELTPAVGNARVNARGDELGPGGKIVRSRESVLKEYYDQAQGMPEENAVSKVQSKAAAESQMDVPEKDLTDDWVEPAGVADTDDWVEDEDGNFVQKGD
jgi:hypothetical protein